jgi:small GTP-binding protein
MPVITIKAIMIGMTAVGKSSILLKITQGLFDEVHNATIGLDFLSYKFEYNANEYIVDIWDTAGQERFKSITATYYKGSDIVFVTVAADDGVRKNLDYLQASLKFYFEHANATNIYVFVNKIDLMDRAVLDAEWNQHEEEVKAIRDRFNIKQINFVSAKTTSK